MWKAMFLPLAVVVGLTPAFADQASKRRAAAPVALAAPVTPPVPPRPTYDAVYFDSADRTTTYKGMYCKGALAAVGEPFMSIMDKSGTGTCLHCFGPDCNWQ